MTDKKLISVIVTAYNIKDYLPRCLESLLGQTYERLEIIVVDDGSTDGTAEICDRFASKYEQIEVIHQENGGPSAARNAGLKIALGERAPGESDIEGQWGLWAGARWDWGKQRPHP